MLGLENKANEYSRNDTCCANSPLIGDLQWDDIGEMGSICMPQRDTNKYFEITNMRLHLIHLRVLYKALDHEYSHEHIKSFMEVCTTS